MPHSATAVATFEGSRGSNGGGALEVFTAQKRHPRVQVSPMSMMVAVAAWAFLLPSLLASDPPQHSPMLGHLASSQTVESLRSRRRERIRVKLSPPGISRLSHPGLRAEAPFSFQLGARTE